MWARRKRKKANNNERQRKLLLRDNIESINSPVRFSASLMTMSSRTVGSDLPFWLTLYTMRLSAAGDEDAEESGGNRSVMFVCGCDMENIRINLMCCAVVKCICMEINKFHVTHLPSRCETEERR